MPEYLYYFTGTGMEIYANASTIPLMVVERSTESVTWG